MKKKKKWRKLTGIGAGDHSSPSKITAIRKRILLVIAIEGVRSMVANRIGVIAPSAALNRPAIGAAHAAGIVQSQLQRRLGGAEAGNAPAGAAGGGCLAEAWGRHGRRHGVGGGSRVYDGHGGDTNCRHRRDWGGDVLLPCFLGLPN